MVNMLSESISNISRLHYLNLAAYPPRGILRHIIRSSLRCTQWVLTGIFSQEYTQRHSQKYPQKYFQNSKEYTLYHGRDYSLMKHFLEAASSGLPELQDHYGSD